MRWSLKRLRWAARWRLALMRRALRCGSGRLGQRDARPSRLVARSSSLAVDRPVEEWTVALMEVERVFVLRPDAHVLLRPSCLRLSLCSLQRWLECQPAFSEVEA